MNLNQTNQLGEEKVSKLLLKFSIPAIIGMLVNALYNIVDRIFIGRGIGSLGIAGITITFPLMILIMACGMLIGIGANSLISIRLGENKKEEAELIMGNAMSLLIGISLILTAAGLIFIEPILKVLGASQAVLPYAKDYIQVILWGSVFQSVGFGMNNFIRADGQPKIAMVTMLIGALLNTILDPLFIFVLGWGIRGAALATIFSQMVSAVWVLYYFFGGKSTLKVHLRNLKLNFNAVKSTLAIGAAPFAMQLAASLLTIIMNVTLVTYGGDTAISGMGIVNSVAVLFLMPIFGINQGVQPIIGYNYGAQKYDRVKEALKLAIFSATSIVLIGFVVIQVFPKEIVMLFNREDANLITFGTRALRIFMAFLPIIGFQIVSANYFQSVGKPMQAAFLSLSRQVLVLIPALLILPKFFGLDGALIAGPAADLISSLITGLFIMMELKHLDKKHIES
ncbi:MAG: family efflux transporter [Clostridia bacterium]|jgi:putative MATE family efflux protein|nr:family efflux transporter [Clostridia bacterium]